MGAIPEGFLGEEAPGGQSCIYPDPKLLIPLPRTGFGNRGHTIAWRLPEGRVFLGQRSGGWADCSFFKEWPHSRGVWDSGPSSDPP